MKEISEFMQGWWNCFITFSHNTGINGYHTLKSAGITKDEIELLLLSDLNISEDVLRNIIEYRDSLKTNKSWANKTERYKDKYLAERRISEIEENGDIVLEFKYE